jgi:hypothetical protein
VDFQLAPEVCPLAEGVNRNGMAKRYRKAASRRAARVNRDHGGVPELAAQLCGRSLSMVYKVRNGKAKSAIVQRAIDEAERRILRGQAA